MDNFSMKNIIFMIKLIDLGGSYDMRPLKKKS
jgi:hypothetical protein